MDVSIVTTKSEVATGNEGLCSTILKPQPRTGGKKRGLLRRDFFSLEQNDHPEVSEACNAVPALSSTARIDG